MDVGSHPPSPPAQKPACASGRFLLCGMSEQTALLAGGCNRPQSSATGGDEVGSRTLRISETPRGNT